MSSPEGKPTGLSLPRARRVLPPLGVLLLCAAVSSAKGERFDFTAAGDALGFGKAHGVELVAKPGKPLVVRATGDDPFLFSPPVALRGLKSGRLIVRAAFEGPVRHFRIYFVTKDSPRFGEDKTIWKPIRADGVMREIVIPVGHHEKWRGTITRYRFDLEPGNEPGAVMRLASVRYVLPLATTIADIRTSESVVAPGATTPLLIVLENPSPKAATRLEVRLEHRGKAVSVSPERFSVARIESQRRKVLRAEVRGENEGVAVLDVILRAAGKEITRRQAAFCVARDTPPPGKPGYGVEIHLDGKSPWAVVKKPEQALVVRLGEKSGLAEWWANRSGRYVRVGRIFPLVSLREDKGEKRRLEIVRWRTARAENNGTHRLVLRGRFGEGPDRPADVDARFWPLGEGPWISAEVALEAKRRIELLSFTSPRLLVGDGSFGRDRNEGLVPGVEYLETGERSSSRLDYHTDEYLRTVPHPKKFTSTLMAITRGDLLLALMWPQPRPQGADIVAPAAGFASPNFVEGARNHLMTLFLPSVPLDVPENGWEARRPVKIAPGERLVLRYTLAAKQKQGIHVTEAVPIWLQRYGWPALQKPPRDLAGEIALCLDAYTKTLWHEKERGWNHALPASATMWAPHPYTFNIQFLEEMRATMPAGPKRDRIEHIIALAAQHHRRLTGGRPTGEAYYFAGDDIAGCAEARGRQARAFIRRQRKDGSWGFEPADKRRAKLGPRGKAEVGIVADRAIPVLRYALMTGDAEAESAGLKALEYMKRFVIPRAAQVWEVPVHTPDIMGSARGAEAYRLGYLLTGKREYLERARYWIATGLPFVYFWGHPRWPYWRYATIPVFGATFFRGPNWEGLPVQWCGLVYAEEALRLAELTGERLPRIVAEGIVRSAMWQQITEGKHRGLLPDSYPFAATRGNPPFINPETILRPLWLLRGYDFRINSVVVPRGKDRSLRVSARAKIRRAELIGGRFLRVNIREVRGVAFGVLVCGVNRAPKTVLWCDKPVPRRDRLERDKAGWRYLADRKWLVVNLLGTGRGDDLIFKVSAR